MLLTFDHEGSKGQASDGLLFALRPLLDGQPLGLAVSGGSDSMALLHLMGALASQMPSSMKIEVVTVDHRLRPEAAQEADFVKSVAQTYGFAHQTLVWQDHPASGNVMELGANARYGLMAQWAKERGLARIALAHSANDQAESFLMGLARGAGLDGLCGMRPSFDYEGISYLRPLLSHSREALRNYLKAQGQEWRDDPSNDNLDYTRVRMRALVDQMQKAGISLAAITRSTQNLAQNQPVLKRSLLEAYHRCAHESEGALYLKPAVFAAELPEIRRRMIVAAVRWLSGRRYPARSDQIAQVLAQIEGQCDCTLSGMRLRHLPKGIRISREERALSAPSQGPLWDHRWQIGQKLPEGYQIRALGADGLAQIDNWKYLGLTRQLLVVSPSIWQNGCLLAAPLAQLNVETWPVSQITFEGFLLSH